MTQNINLLEELTVYPISDYNCNLIIRIAIGWILLLTLIYGVTFGTYLTQKRKIATIENTQKTLITKIETYKQELSAFEPTYAGESSAGFSRYLIDLAEFIPQGVWLKEITISEPNGAITLKGSTIVSSGISTLLNSLGKSQTLGNKRFNTLQLDKNIDSENADFTIDTAATTNTEPNKKP